MNEIKNVIQIRFLNKNGFRVTVVIYIDPVNVCDFGKMMVLCYPHTPTNRSMPFFRRSYDLISRFGDLL